MEALLARHSGIWATSRAARLGRRFFWIGALLVATALFLERSGIDVWWIAVPGLEDAHTTAERVVGYVFVSFLGLVQGLLWLATVFVGSVLVRIVLSALWRPGRRATASALDTRLATDRYSAAVEAKGPLAGRVLADAVRDQPPRDALRMRPRKTERWLSVLAVLAVLLVALAPGAAPGAEGRAPVAGSQDPSRPHEPVQLWLRGEERAYRFDEDIPLDVLVEASLPLDQDLEEVVWLSIDSSLPIETRAGLFLPAGAPGEDRATLNLASYLDGLAPGEHTARALAGTLKSNVYRFTLEPPPDPKQKPPPPPDQPKPSGKGGQKPKPKTTPKYVEPLVRDGEKVKKKARVPVETPGGAAPQTKTLREAWPDLERRREAALDRPGLSPAARRLVREYFEKLRPTDGVAAPDQTEAGK